MAISGRRVKAWSRSTPLWTTFPSIIGRETDILHVEEAPAEELPYGGSAIWLKPDAAVERCVTHRTSTEARFLTGEIGARMAGGGPR
jgi:hypothetical protein